MSFPAVRLEAAWGAGPLTAAPAWQPTGKLRALATTGTTRQSETDRFGAGTMTATLDDPDRALDPTNTASAPDPGVYTPVRAVATLDGVDFPLWRGYADTWEPDWSSTTDAPVTLSAVDLFAYLATAPLRGAGYQQEVLATPGLRGFWRLGDAKGSTRAIDASPAGRHGTVVGDAGFGAAALITGDPDTAANLNGQGIDGQGAIDLPTAAALTGPGDWTVEAWVQCPAGTTNPSTIYSQGGTTGLENITLQISAPNAFFRGGTVVLRVSDGTFATFSAIETPQTGPNLYDGARHLIHAGRTGNFLGIWVDGVLTAAAALTAPFSLPAAPTRIGAFADTGNLAIPLHGIVDEVATYTVALDEATIDRHWALGSAPWVGDHAGARSGRVLDLLGIPAALRRLDAGQSEILAPAEALATTGLDYLLKVWEAEGGRLFLDPDGAIVGHERWRPLRNSTPTASFSDVDRATQAQPAGTLPYLTGGVRAPLSLSELANEVSMARAGGGDQVERDQASIDQLKAVRSLRQDGLLITTDGEAATRARYVLNNRRLPHPRVRQLTLDQRVHPSLIEQMVTRRVGDLITVAHHPAAGGPAFEAQVRIEGIGHTLNPKDRQWVTTWQLSTADTTPYLIIGDGPRSRIGSNAIAY